MVDGPEIQSGLQLHTVEIGLHTQFIGEIRDIKAEVAILGDNGLPDIEKVKPILYVPESTTYYGVGGFLGKAYSIGRRDLKDLLMEMS